jgi:hypothetical protein
MPLARQSSAVEEHMLPHYALGATICTAWQEDLKIHEAVERAHRERDFLCAVVSLGN